jgi:hypothetical protein
VVTQQEHLVVLVVAAEMILLGLVAQELLVKVVMVEVWPLHLWEQVAVEQALSEVVTVV